MTKMNSWQDVNLRYSISHKNTYLEINMILKSCHVFVVNTALVLISSDLYICVYIDVFNVIYCDAISAVSGRVSNPS